MDEALTKLEFYQFQSHEVLSESQSREIIRPQAFFEIINEDLIESGELTHNYEYAFFQARSIEVCGFDYDDERKILSLMVSQYFDSDEINPLTQAAIDTKFERLRNFLEKVCKDDYNDIGNNEVYSMAYNISEMIRGDEVDKFKLFLLTNGTKTRNYRNYSY